MWHHTLSLFWYYTTLNGIFHSTIVFFSCLVYIIRVHVCWVSWEAYKNIVFLVISVFRDIINLLEFIRWRVLFLMDFYNIHKNILEWAICNCNVFYFELFLHILNFFKNLRHFIVWGNLEDHVAVIFFQEHWPREGIVDKLYYFTHSFIAF